MVKVVAHNYISKENIETAKPMYRELVAETLKETGCIEYSLFVDTKDETHFVFVEQWESQSDLDAHFKAEHFTRLIPALGELQYKKGDVDILQSFE